jgi:hypothetical protein
MARLVRTGLEANGGICRSLLAVRHGVNYQDGEDAQGGLQPTTATEEERR